ncbi:hypothetical protein HPB50_005603 [Hyalomma asiaticum]|uniref:Uncharacterized protein n=1 Tax=Hyalomma asiaticum TaxID=266040 RepID=A0ACB7RH16_HYAAI|nr:hypothetical protein HPB50_005603 [Hyalomma asiaticum]
MAFFKSAFGGNVCLHPMAADECSKDVLGNASPASLFGKAAGASKSRDSLSLADRLHIWRSEAQILVCLSLLLWLWRLRVPWLLLVLAACAYSSGRGWSPSLALEAAASGVFSFWFQSMECIGVAVDGGLRKVLPQQWKMEQAVMVVLTTMRRVTFASVLVSAAFLQRLWYALVHWRRELWEAYLHHSDAISVPAEARGSPPRIARRATFSGVVDRVEVTDRTPPER